MLLIHQFESIPLFYLSCSATSNDIDSVQESQEAMNPFKHKLKAY